MRLSVWALQLVESKYGVIGITVMYIMWIFKDKDTQPTLKYLNKKSLSKEILIGFLMTIDEAIDLVWGSIRFVPGAVRPTHEAALRMSWELIQNPNKFSTKELNNFTKAYNTLSAVPTMTVEEAIDFVCKKHRNTEKAIQIAREKLSELTKTPLNKTSGADMLRIKKYEQACIALSHNNQKGI